jgi:hypothetical protein
LTRAATATFESRFAPSVLDQDAPHRFRSRGKEMAA